MHVLFSFLKLVQKMASQMHFFPDMLVYVALAVSYLKIFRSRVGNTFQIKQQFSVCCPPLNFSIRLLELLRKYLGRIINNLMPRCRKQKTGTRHSFQSKKKSLPERVENKRRTLISLRAKFFPSDRLCWSLLTNQNFRLDIQS